MLITMILFGTLAFTLIGCGAPSKRWHHLCFVTVGILIANFVYVLGMRAVINNESYVKLGDAPPTLLNPVVVQYLIVYTVLVVFYMMLGGAISYLFKKKTVIAPELKGTK